MTQDEVNKVLNDFATLHGSIEKLTAQPTVEKQQCLTRLTESGMWFRMIFEMERLEKTPPTFKLEKKTIVRPGHTRQ